MNIIDSLCYAARRNALLLVLLIAGPLLPAQQRSFQVVPERSTARIFLGSAEKPASFDLGVAKVTGEMQLNSDDVGASHFTLTISSAVPNDQKIFGEQSVITLQSESVEQRKDGKLEVTAELTVTQVMATGAAAAGEQDARSLADNSKPMRTTQRVVFVLSGLGPSATTSGSPGTGAVSADEDKPESGMLVAASTSVDGESFPELLFAVQDVAWPRLGGSNNCGTPSAPGQNYNGATCSALTSQGESSDGHAGFQQQEPAGNLITIQLRLSLGGGDNDADTSQDTRASR